MDYCYCSPRELVPASLNGDINAYQIGELVCLLLQREMDTHGVGELIEDFIQRIMG
jgi:hypothetical protein